MANKYCLTHEQEQEIVNLFNQGYNRTDISNKLNIKFKDVDKYLKINNYIKIKIPNGINITYEDIEKIRPLYSKGDHKTICELYPELNEYRIHQLANAFYFYRDEFFWTEEEKDILINNYGKMSYKEISKLLNNTRTIKSINKMAGKLGLVTSEKWSKEENDILIQNYSIMNIKKILSLLPNRSIESIKNHARVLKLKSYKPLNIYTEEEIAFIKNNFGVLSDEEIAVQLNRTAKGIRYKRQSIGLYYLNKDYTKYTEFADLFRAHLQSWKTQSMDKCNYKCILTGSKEYDIHHLFGFNCIINIVFDILSDNNKLTSQYIKDYSKDELEYIVDLFQDVHSKYPLGVCIRTDIHKLFHKLYGSGGNTEAQWNNFVERYNNHEFEDKYYN